ncbi:cytochrome P450 26B1-like [Haliotis rubra]|uniref:cytochrome P450 26B1-like n=1 Tax=Haliotis rubra TaxID=36100 RepID=UPI001EE50398|nr:cytochrome P450 26B1-like [Haliotis rubra]
MLSGEDSLKVLASVVPVALCLIIWKLWNMHNYSLRDRTCSLPLPPGSMGLPLIGESLHFVLMGANFYRNRLKSYGSVSKTNILGNPTILVLGAKNVRKILMGETSLVASYWPQSVRTLMGEGTVSHSEGPIHKTRRKSIGKAFNHEAMSSYLLESQVTFRYYIKRWCSQATVLGFDECKKLSLRFACHVLIGFKVSEKEIEELMELYAVFAEGLFSIPLNIPGSGFHKGMIVREKLMKKIGEFLDRRKDWVGAPDALTYMMKLSEEVLTRTELKEVVMELLFTGHVTSGSAACSLLLYLGKNREVLNHVVDELRQHNIDDDEGKITLGQLGKLKYVSNVVKEVMRIAPPVGGGFRKALKTFELDGYQIPKGWTVAFSIREAQEQSDSFPDGDKFNPDRWDALTKERETFFPFGAGRRVCVGKELGKLMLKCFLVELAVNCRWDLLNKYPVIEEMPVPRPIDGLPVVFSSLRKLGI